MASSKLHRIWFGLPATQANAQFLAALGVGMLVETLTNADRLAVIQQTKTIAQLKLDYPAVVRRIDDESLNWQDGWSNDGGATKTHFLGEIRLTAGEWARLQAVVPSAPTGFRYARFTAIDDVLRETNIAALTNLVGSVQNPRLLLDAAGFIPYQPGASNP